FSIHGIRSVAETTTDSKPAVYSPCDTEVGTIPCRTDQGMAGTHLFLKGVRKAGAHPLLLDNLRSTPGGRDTAFANQRNRLDDWLEIGEVQPSMFAGGGKPEYASLPHRLPHRLGDVSKPLGLVGVSGNQRLGPL